MTFFLLKNKLQIAINAAIPIKSLLLTFLCTIICLCTYIYVQETFDDHINEHIDLNQELKRTLTHLKRSRQNHELETIARANHVYHQPSSAHSLKSTTRAILKPSNYLITPSPTNSTSHALYKTSALNIKFKNTPDHDVFNLISTLLTQHRQFGCGRIYEFHLQRDDTPETTCCASGNFCYQQFILSSP